MTTTPLPPLPEPDIWSHVVTVWRDEVECQIDQGPRFTSEQMQAYAQSARADLEAENKRLQRIAWLVGSIFAHGDFKAETHNERELEKLLRENGTFLESLADFDARAALEKQP